MITVGEASGEAGAVVGTNGGQQSEASPDRQLGGFAAVENAGGAAGTGIVRRAAAVLQQEQAQISAAIAIHIANGQNLRVFTDREFIVIIEIISQN